MDIRGHGSAGLFMRSNFMVPTNNLPAITKIRRWGNSMGVRLPKGMLKRAKLGEGTKVKIEQTARGILLSVPEKPRRKRKYTLRQLCAGMTPVKSQREVDWGGPVGSEIW
jgi:antitoxin MazE